MSTAPSWRSPAARRAVIGLEVFTAVGAVVGAIGLITDGDRFMGGTVDVHDLPLHNWPFAGIVLLLLNGLLPALATVAELRRHPRAAAMHLTAGVVLMAWIIVQVAFIGLVFALQPLMFMVGLALVVLTRRFDGGGSTAGTAS